MAKSKVSIYLEDNFKNFAECHNLFKPYCSPEDLSNLNENYTNLRKNLDSAFANNLNTVHILYGSPGFGRKSCVYYTATNFELKPEIIELDILIEKSEAIIEKKIIQTFIKDDVSDIRKKSQDKMSNLTLTSLQKYELKKPIIILIDHIDLLCSVKRQSLLYKLFEFVSGYSSKIAIIGVTNNLGFADNLEKRVKSRISMV